MAQKVILMVFDVIDLDLDISSSFDFGSFNIFPCMAGVIFEGICSLLAEICNIEIWKNSLFFIMGICRCHGNVRYVFFWSMQFSKVHSIVQCNMCIHFEKNRLTIDDFRSRFSFFIIQLYHNENIQNSHHFHMTLTFYLDLTLTLNLTLDLEDWKNISFIPNIWFLEVTWRKNVTSYGTFCNQQEVSTTSGSKVIAHYVIFTDFF